MPSANGKRSSNVGANGEPVFIGSAPVGATLFSPPAFEREREDDERPGPLSRALKAMEKAGLEGVHPGDRNFVELVTRGAKPALFRIAAFEAKAKGKGYPWAMAMAIGRLNDGVIDLDGNAIRKPAKAPPSVDRSSANGLVSTEAREALRARLNDPTADPWALPEIPSPSPSESDVPY